MGRAGLRHVELVGTGELEIAYTFVRGGAFHGENCGVFRRVR